MRAVVDPVLVDLKARLSAAYGQRLDRVVLFGSRARGEARPDSDYDVAVFLGDFKGFAVEARRLAGIEADLLLERGAIINVAPFVTGADRERTPLMAELRRDGRDL